MPVVIDKGNCNNLNIMEHIPIKFGIKSNYI